MIVNQSAVVAWCYTLYLRGRRGVLFPTSCRVAGRGVLALGSVKCHYPSRDSTFQIPLPISIYLEIKVILRVKHSIDYLQFLPDIH